MNQEANQILRHVKITLLAGAAAISFATQAAAQAETRHRYDIPAQDATSALQAYAKQSGKQVLFSYDAVKGRRSPALQGEYGDEEALAKLLAGTGLVVTSSDGTIITLAPAGSGPSTGEFEAASAARAENAAINEREIVVTGTRVKGASPASPVVVVDAQRMREAGHHSLDEVVRNIPQNFNGGTNAGVAPGSSSFNMSNSNATGGTGVNLRGLGPDATLTLLNGRRLAYGGRGQAVDISAIPIAAVDRIEIVADGASAVYGSDAVAGVVNVILKRNFDGVSTGVRIGVPTDGGGLERQYSIVGGGATDRSGIIAAYNVEDNDPIYSHQRSYLSYMPRPNTIYQESNRHNLVLSAYHRINDDVQAAVDILYSDLDRHLDSNSPPTRNTSRSKLEDFTISPSVTFDLFSTWTGSLGGVYASSRYENDATISGASVTRYAGCECSSTKMAELGMEGELVQLPAGPFRLALGAGYRHNKLDVTFQSLVSSREEQGKQDSYYAYAEVNVPLISDENANLLADRLSLSGALRYEKYIGMRSVATPKLGIVYAPLPGLELKGSWGKSFKSPTLFQEHQNRYVYLEPVSNYGGIGYPESATVLYLTGGNNGLEPEKARSTSATLVIRPTAVPGLRAQVTYFHVKYYDRVLNPFASQAALGAALANPAFANYIMMSPSADDLAAAQKIDSDGIIDNYYGVNTDPQNIVAIIDNRFTNISRQNIKGIDVNVDYSFDLDPGSFTISGQASWLESHQQVVSSGSSMRLAGTVFNPAHWRTRAGATWRQDRLTLSAFVNHIGGVDDVRMVPVRRIGSMTTLDATALFKTGQGTGLLGNMELSLSVSNLTNERPPHMINQSNILVNYDSTNYSAVGRLVAISLLKRW